MSTWESARSGSLFLTWVAKLRRRLADAATESWVFSQCNQGLQALERAAATSRVGAAGRTLARWTRNSWLYRWLTTEPTEDIIVIDLRETWTVGLVIAGLDRGASALARVSGRRGPRKMGHRVDSAFRAAPLKFLGIVAVAAVLTSALVTAAVGSLSESELGLHLLSLAPAVLATRVDASWTELQTGRVVRLLKTVFEPPPVPEDESRDDE